MAEKRMFSKIIIDSNLFLDMPLSTQALYFHLSMRADDEGFINSPKKIQRAIGCTDDDLKLLIAKSFVIPFESGIIVIKHWRIHNTLRKDRTKPTTYSTEKAMLQIENNGVYSIAADKLSTKCPPTVNQVSTKCPHRLDKIRLDEIRLDKDSLGEEQTEQKKPAVHKYGEYKHVKLTDDQYTRLVSDFGEQKTSEYIRRCDEYCQQYGKSYKDYNLTLRNWIAKDNAKNNQATPDYNTAGFWEASKNE